MNLTLCFTSVLFLVLAIVLYIGKGDWLIAGYNTASQKEREKFNIKRLRLVMSVLMVLTSLFVFAQCFISPVYMSLATTGFVVICLIGLIMANTWAKK